MLAWMAVSAVINTAMFEFRGPHNIPEAIAWLASFQPLLLFRLPAFIFIFG
jgi:hypothetical protein